MKAAIFMINRECNQECRFCLNNWESKKELTLFQKKKVLDKLKNNGVEIIVFSGGEPFLSPELKPLVNYANELEFKVIIQTNGTLLNEKVLKSLKILGLEISLEGLEKEHNILVQRLNFRKVVRNIELAIKLGMNVTTNFTITKLNYKCIEDYVKMLENIGVKVANFTKLYLSGRALENKSLQLNEKEYENFLEALSKIKSKVILNVQAGFKEEILKKFRIKDYSTCSIGKEITITPDGSVRLCPAWSNSWANALTSDLTFIKDIKPEDGCLVNSLKEAKCTGLGV
jgi:MoaA/NifB/PqqE/SkfB family radical SAM enzyme